MDPRSPLSVGNGQFAFTADVTGLQSLAETYYSEGIPTETMARWAWHSEPNTAGYTLADASTRFDSPRGPLLLPTKASSPAGEWLRRNPHMLPLAEVRLEYAETAGSPPRRLRREDLTNVDQTLDLWHGLIESRYTLGGQPVRVTTAVHPTQDTLAVRIDSPLASEGRLRIVVAFPRGHRLDIKNTPPLDWTHPETHTTRVLGRTTERLNLERVLDATQFRVTVAPGGSGQVADTALHRHEVTVTSTGLGPLGLALTFSPSALDPTPATPGTSTVDATLAAARAHWPTFWARGGAVDFSGSTDPRAAELERRVVLSQYLTAIQSVAAIPPQESGLTCNTWYGKHHTEMIAWHTAHFALWGRGDMLARNLEWYREQLPMARKLAVERRLRGARWPKMVGPEGRESPGGNPLIVWNQPHPIQLSELLYRGSPNAEILARYKDLVFETADALASMVHLDAATGRYALGPPLWIAQEIYDQATSQNPSFELAYWSWALDVAQRWRERLGLPRRADWDDDRRETHAAARGRWSVRRPGLSPRHLPKPRLPPRPPHDVGTLWPAARARRRHPDHAPNAHCRPRALGLRDQDLGLGLPHDRHDGGPAR